LYSFIKDIIKYFQDNYLLIKNNFWTFLFFAIIIFFAAYFILKGIYSTKITKYKSECDGLSAKNKELNDINQRLISDVSKLNKQIEKTGTFMAIERKKQNTNDTFADHLNDEFSS
jgi:hypothetical protein